MSQDGAVIGGQGGYGGTCVSGNGGKGGRGGDATAYGNNQIPHGLGGQRGVATTNAGPTPVQGQTGTNA